MFFIYLALAQTSGNAISKVQDSKSLADADASAEYYSDEEDVPKKLQ